MYFQGEIVHLFSSKRNRSKETLLKFHLYIFSKKNNFSIFNIYSYYENTLQILFYNTSKLNNFLQFVGTPFSNFFNLACLVNLALISDIILAKSVILMGRWKYNK